MFYSSVSFSGRSDVPRALNAVTRALEDRKTPPAFDLTCSNPASAGIAQDEALVRDAIANTALTSYEPHPLGHPAARQAVAKALLEDGVNNLEANILLTASTSEAYAHLFRLLCDPAEEVLVPEPSYPLFAHLARQSGVHVASYPLIRDASFRIDAGQLYEAVSDRTRAIVVVSPNNPTGNYVGADELGLLESFGLPLIIDEVFFGYALVDDVGQERLAAASSVLTFSLDGLSKRAALPGMKLAWTSATGPEAEVEEAMRRLEMIADTFLSPNTPVQLALSSLLSIREPVRETIRVRAKVNLERLGALTDNTPLTLPRVEGGWYTPIRLPATESDEAWTLRLLAEHDVLVQPGYFYDFPSDESWVVVSLLTREEAFEEGVAALVRLVG